MKINWKTLFQAMIIPAICVCLFVVLVALPVMQSQVELDEAMESQTMGSVYTGHSIFDPTFLPILIFLISFPVGVFLIGTIVLYIVIDHLKKKKK